MKNIQDIRKATASRQAQQPELTLNAVINVRCTNAEKERLLLQARRDEARGDGRGPGLSNYIRRRLKLPG